VSDDGERFWIGYADKATVVDAPAGITQTCELIGRCTPPLGTKVVLAPRPVRLS
jgi:hypothetical protein